MAFFVALEFVRFVSESRPARWIELVEISRRYPLTGTMSRAVGAAKKNNHYYHKWNIIMTSAYHKQEALEWLIV